MQLTCPVCGKTFTGRPNDVKNKWIEHVLKEHPDHWRRG